MDISDSRTLPNFNAMALNLNLGGANQAAQQGGGAPPLPGGGPPPRNSMGHGGKRGMKLDGKDRFQTIMRGASGIPLLFEMLRRNPVLLCHDPQTAPHLKKVMVKKTKAPKIDVEKEVAAATVPLTIDDSINEREPLDPAELELFGMGLFGDDDAEVPSLRKVGVKSTREEEEEEDTTASPPGQVPPHQQMLQAMITTYYEWNHATFMKLPLKQTLNALKRDEKRLSSEVANFEGTARLKKRQKLEVDTQRAARAEADTMLRQDRELALAERRQVHLDSATGGGDDTEYLLMQQAMDQQGSGGDDMMMGCGGGIGGMDMFGPPPGEEEEDNEEEDNFHQQEQGATKKKPTRKEEQGWEGMQEVGLNPAGGVTGDEPTSILNAPLMDEKDLLGE